MCVCLLLIVVFPYNNERSRLDKCRCIVTREIWSCWIHREFDGSPVSQTHCASDAPSMASSQHDDDVDDDDGTFPLHRIVCSWHQQMSCFRCFLPIPDRCRCHATIADHAAALIETYGTNTIFVRRETCIHEYRSDEACYECDRKPFYSYRTLVTMVLCTRPRWPELAIALVEAGVPWLVPHPRHRDIRVCLLPTPSFGAVGLDWQVVVPRWIAVGFNVNWPLETGWTLLASAIESASYNVHAITQLVQTHGCDALAPSYLLNETPVQRVTALYFGVRWWYTRYCGLTLLCAQQWPIEIVRGCEEILVEKCNLGWYSDNDEQYAPFHAYARHAQALAVMLGCRRHHRKTRRNFHLPFELWHMICTEFILVPQ